jgi:hypothetical protein
VTLHLPRKSFPETRFLERSLKGGPCSTGMRRAVELADCSRPRGR